jgi:hypothetical protein
MEKFDPMRLPCGGTAFFDQDSGISYRCWDCMAVVGSIGQPQSCKDAVQKYDNWQRLGGKGWDYFEGIEDEYLKSR